MAWWIKMPLGMEVGLGQGHIVLDGDPAPLRKRSTALPIFGPCLLWPNGWMDQEGTWHGARPWPRPHCARWVPSSPPPKKGTQSPQFSAHVCCGQMAWWIKIPLGTGIGLGPDHIVLYGDPAPPTQKEAQTPETFWPMFIVVKRSPISAMLSTCSILLRTTLVVQAE